jgi:hypothetical protein
MEVRKTAGYSRVYQAECFAEEIDGIFGKSAGEKKRCLRWLYAWLTVLDRRGVSARNLNLNPVEPLKNTEKPRLYALRHFHSPSNERYIFAEEPGCNIILLTAFKEYATCDYKPAICRASRIYSEIPQRPAVGTAYCCRNKTPLRQ